VAVQQRPQQPPVAVAAAAAVADLMQRTVESRIPPAEELQPAVVRKVARTKPAQMLVDTAEVVVERIELQPLDLMAKPALGILITG